MKPKRQRAKSIKVYVYFANGMPTAYMTLRRLCGWARLRNARVQTDDGWPVVNGRVKSFTAEPQLQGVVKMKGGILAAWTVNKPEVPCA